MTVPLFQRLGGFVAVAENLSDDKLAAFAQAGGAWIVPLIHGDDKSGPWNLAHLEDTIRPQAARYGVRCGGWLNLWGGDPDKDAQQVAAIVNAHPGLAPIVLDLEAAYHYPDGDPELMPRLVLAVRRLLPVRRLAVSTNSLNDSMIWNGRGATPQRSFRELGVRCLPQWYSSPAYGSPWMNPVDNMRWLSQHGAEDNFHDPKSPTGRAVPLSYVHGTLEATGLEGSSLSLELSQLAAAREHGFSKGFSLYTLENTPDSDIALCAAVRGVLYL